MTLKNCLVYRNGNFVRMDLSVEKGIFVDSPSEPLIDATGYYVMPGFVDSHAHVIGTGHKYGHVNLENVGSIEELLEILQVGDPSVIIGRGWSEEKLGAKPTRELLDRLEKPVLLIRRCGHVAVANTPLMKLAGKWREDGVFKEQDLEELRKELPLREDEKFFKIGQERFLMHGVTFVHSDDLHGLSWGDLREILKDSKMRIFEKVYFSSLSDLERFDGFGQISDRVIVKAVKLFVDGSVGGRTAWLSVPYADDPSNSGTKLIDEEELEKFTILCERKNVQLCVHAIGDQAVHTVAKVFSRHPKHRVIHAQLVRDEDLSLLRGSFFSIQPHFAFEDRHLIESVLPEDLKALRYPFLMLFQQGFRIAFSTDAPVSPEDPKYVIECAMKLGFTKQQAIELYTVAGARMAGLNNVGEIKTGFLADFCLYEKNPLDLDEDPVAVYVAGELVHEK
ncbi:MAG: amidohydrolase [Pseudothermotoga sp.]|uniref:amidohydrolase n=1 Tax=Pseudothermotoga sp. TaxID=2033661 RepID=UPI000AD6A524|nr:amidohydrolase [Pseudothermotoga sp.]HBT38646.1 amidohydrolase [Pseudothermotoga sp.]HCO98159.1 amidohydrolase [Pseudothermotoga sp.]